MPWLIKPDMHHTWLCIMPCLCLLVYHVVCFFPVVLLLDSSGYVAIVRICSTTPVRLLHGFRLLPSRISGKMTVTLDLTTIFAMLVVSMLSLCRATHHLFIKPPNMPWEASNLFHLPSQPLFGYVTALLSPSYSVASCRLFHVGTWISWISWDITILLFN